MIVFVKSKLEKLYGVLFLIGIAIVSKYLGASFINIGPIIFALIIGVFIRNFIGIQQILLHGIQFTLKRILKLAIILLGTSLSLSTAASIGNQSLVVITIVVLIGTLATYIIGKILHINNDLRILISVGCSICGASAITTAKTIINAKDAQTAYAISLIFFFNLLSMLLFPIIGDALQLTDIQFGIWAGLAIHDMSSAVALGYAYGDIAGEYSTIVKLIRVLFLLPIVVVLSVWVFRNNIKAHKDVEDRSFIKRLYATFPWFIIGFLIMSLVNTYGFIPTNYEHTILSSAKFMIVMVMAAVGLQVEWKSLKTLGWQPLVVGFFASFFISMFSLLIIVTTF